MGADPVAEQRAIRAAYIAGIDPEQQTRRAKYMADAVEEICAICRASPRNHRPKLFETDLEMHEAEAGRSVNLFWENF